MGSMMGAVSQFSHLKLHENVLLRFQPPGFMLLQEFVAIA